MEERSTRDIERVRLRFVDLIKSFFLEEPDGEKISRWRGIFTALSAEQISTEVDNAVAEIASLLESKSLKEIQEEHYELIGNPFSKNMLSLSASFYIDGRTYGPSLAEFRGFIQEAGIAMNEDVKETEDSLTVMLDCLGSLIELGSDEGGDTEKFQGVLINTHLAPLAKSLSEALVENEHAHFYEACGRFLLGYVELEKGLFELV